MASTGMSIFLRAVEAGIAEAVDCIESEQINEPLAMGNRIFQAMINMAGEDAEDPISDRDDLLKEIESLNAIIAGYERSLARVPDFVPRVGKVDAESNIKDAVETLSRGIAELLDEGTYQFDDVGADEIRRPFMDAVRVLFDVDPPQDQVLDIQPEPTADAPDSAADAEDIPVPDMRSITVNVEPGYRMVEVVQSDSPTDYIRVITLTRIEDDEPEVAEVDDES